MRAARKGDRTAFEELVSAYQPELDRYLHSVLRSVPHIDVADVSQDVWIYVHEKLGVYLEDHTFGQFLFGLARNIVLRALTKKERAVTVGNPEEILHPVLFGPSAARGSSLAGMMIDRDFLAEKGLGRDGSDSLDESAIFRELLELTMRCGGHPHQVIAFSYSIVIYGQPKKRMRKTGGARRVVREKVSVTGKPSLVVEHHSEQDLKHLTHELMDFYAAGVEWDRDGVRRACRPHIERLMLRGRELFAKDPTSAEQFAGLLRRTIGGTALREYYGRTPSKSVADWTNVVKDRVRRRLNGGGDCERCVYLCNEIPREERADSVDTPDRRMTDTAGPEASR